MTCGTSCVCMHVGVAFEVHAYDEVPDNGPSNVGLLWIWMRCHNPRDLNCRPETFLPFPPPLEVHPLNTRVHLPPSLTPMSPTSASPRCCVSLPSFLNPTSVNSIPVCAAAAPQPMRTPITPKLTLTLTQPNQPCKRTNLNPTKPAMRTPSHPNPNPTHTSCAAASFPAASTLSCRSRSARR